MNHPAVNSLPPKSKHLAIELIKALLEENQPHLLIFPAIEDGQPTLHVLSDLPMSVQRGFNYHLAMGHPPPPLDCPT